jgi:abhydrolase domain-containing protein 6
MAAPWQEWIDRFRPRVYERKQPLVLINGLAEQSESWYRNIRFWRRHFELLMPNLLLYDGEVIHNRVKQDLPISVPFLVEQLHTYLTQFVQTPPYHICASSLGGKIAVEFAVRYPELVSRMVLLCPSGMGDVEQLPVVEGVRHNDMKALIDSVFYNPKLADKDMCRFYLRKFPNRRWRMGLLRTIRGTMDHVVRDLLPQVRQPTLFVAGEHDQIVNPKVAEVAAASLPQGQFLCIPKCGHAPQLEKAWLINRLVLHFLTHPQPTAHPRLLQLLINNRRTTINESS